MPDGYQEYSDAIQDLTARYTEMQGIPTPGYSDYGGRQPEVDNLAAALAPPAMTYSPAYDTANWFEQRYAATAFGQEWQNRADRAAEMSNNVQLAGGIISAASTAVGSAFGSPLLGTGIGMLMQQITPDLAAAMGYNTEAQGLTMEDQMRAYMSSMIHRQAWNTFDPAMTGGVIRGISMESSTQVANQLFTQMRGLGLGGGELGDILPGLQQAGAFEGTQNITEMTDRLSSYINVITDFVKKTNATFTEATAVVGAGLGLGASIGEMGQFMADTRVYAGAGGISPAQLLENVNRYGGIFQGQAGDFSSLVSEVGGNYVGAREAFNASVRTDPNNEALWRRAGGYENVANLETQLGLQIWGSPTGQRRAAALWMMGAEGEGMMQAYSQTGHLPSEVTQRWENASVNERLEAQFHAGEWTAENAGELLDARIARMTEQARNAGATSEIAQAQWITNRLQQEGANIQNAEVLTIMQSVNRQNSLEGRFGAADYLLREQNSQDTTAGLAEFRTTGANIFRASGMATTQSDVNLGGLLGAGVTERVNFFNAFHEANYNANESLWSNAEGIEDWAARMGGEESDEGWLSGYGFRTRISNRDTGRMTENVLNRISTWQVENQRGRRIQGLDIGNAQWQYDPRSGQMQAIASEEFMAQLSDSNISLMDAQGNIVRQGADITDLFTGIYEGGEGWRVEYETEDGRRTTQNIRGMGTTIGQWNVGQNEMYNQLREEGTIGYGDVYHGVTDELMTAAIERSMRGQDVFAAASSREMTASLSGLRQAEANFGLVTGLTDQADINTLQTRLDADSGFQDAYNKLNTITLDNMVNNFRTDGNGYSMEQVRQVADEMARQVYGEDADFASLSPERRETIQNMMSYHYSGEGGRSNIGVQSNNLTEEAEYALEGALAAAAEAGTTAQADQRLSWMGEMSQDELTKLYEAYAEGGSTRDVGGYMALLAGAGYGDAEKAIEQILAYSTANVATMASQAAGGVFANFAIDTKSQVSAGQQLIDYLSSGNAQIVEGADAGFKSLFDELNEGGLDAEEIARLMQYLTDPNFGATPTGTGDTTGGGGGALPATGPNGETVVIIANAEEMANAINREGEFDSNPIRAVLTRMANRLDEIGDLQGETETPS